MVIFTDWIFGEMATGLKPLQTGDKKENI